MSYEASTVPSKDNTNPKFMSQEVQNKYQIGYTVAYDLIIYPL